MNYVNSVENTLESTIQSIRRYPGNGSEIQRAIEFMSNRLVTIPAEDLLTALTTILLTSSSWSMVGIASLKIGELYHRHHTLYTSSLAGFCISAIDNAYSPPSYKDAGMTGIAKNLAKAQFGDGNAQRAVSEYIRNTPALAHIQQSQQASALAAAFYVTISTHED